MDFGAADGPTRVVKEALRQDFHTLEEGRPHIIKSLGLTERPLAFKSQGTRINYAGDSFEFLLAYLAPAAVSFKEALGLAVDVARTLELDGALKTGRYENSLATIPDTEPYIPRAGWHPYDLGLILNCGWSRTQKAALELSTVACRPYLFVDRAIATDGGLTKPIL